MKVYLFRHGEVENPKNLFYGRLPGFHLSEEGREHVRKTASRLKKSGIKKVYSSPLERAIETSEIIIDVLGLKETDLIVDERLIESDVSKWQGTNLDEYKKNIVFKIDHKNHHEYELINKAGDRVLSVLNGPIKQGGEGVIVVSHGDPLVGVLINITGDWSYVDHDAIKRKYIKKGEFVKLKLENNNWEIEEYSYL